MKSLQSTGSLSTLDQGGSHHRTFPAKALCLGVALGLALTPQVHGLGLRIPNQDPEAIARGNAFIATANNPSAIYYNPAGITQIEGHQAQLGLHALSANAHYDGGGMASDEDTKSEFLPVPQFYYTYSPKDSHLSLGLGVYVPFGLGLEWPENTAFRNLAIEGRLNYTTVSPVIAYELFENLSIAAGPTFSYSSLMLRRGIGFVPNDEFRFRGDGFTVGAKAGVLWQPHEKWSFGASYQSQTTLEYEGNTSVKPLAPGQTSSTLEVDFPQFIMAGVSFRPTTNWNFEVGVDWTDWDVVDTVVFEDTAFGDAPFPLNWRSSWLIYSGATRTLKNGFWVGGGYFFSQNSTSEGDFNPILPDSNLHVGSLGVGQKLERWSWAVAGQLITGPAREIDNGSPANGEYSWFNYALNLSAGYRF